MSHSWRQKGHLAPNLCSGARCTSRKVPFYTPSLRNGVYNVNMWSAQWSCIYKHVNAVVTTTIRLRFDGRSTACQRSLRSQWRNTGRWPANCSHADLVIYLGLSVAAAPPRTQACGRNVGRRMVVAQSNRRRIVHCLNDTVGGINIIIIIIIIISVYWSGWHTQLNYSGECSEQ